MLDTAREVATFMLLMKSASKTNCLWSSIAWPHPLRTLMVRHGMMRSCLQSPRFCMMIAPVMSQWCSQTRTQCQLAAQCLENRRRSKADRLQDGSYWRKVQHQDVLQLTRVLTSCLIISISSLLSTKVVRNKVHRMKEMRRMKAAERWAKKAGVEVSRVKGERDPVSFRLGLRTPLLLERGVLVLQ